MVSSDIEMCLSVCVLGGWGAHCMVVVYNY